MLHPQVIGGGGWSRASVAAPSTRHEPTIDRRQSGPCWARDAANWLSPECVVTGRVIEELPGLADASVAKCKDNDGVLLQGLTAAGGLVAVHRDRVGVSADDIIEGHGQGSFRTCHQLAEERQDPVPALLRP